MALETSSKDQSQSTVNSTTQPFPPSQGPVPPGLLGDPTASAIHDAFLIGWSLIELKSRVQAEVFKREAAAQARNAQQKTASAAPTSHTTPPPSASTMTASPASVQHALSSIDTWLEEVKQLTQDVVWQGTETEATPSARLTGDWRALFNRIGSIQNKRFHDSTTIGTSYDPPDDSQLPYLHPGYANKGIISQANNTLEKFRLYDVTRRTLNCLTLLYTDANESLIPELLGDYQTQLVQNIFNPASPNPAPQNDVVSPDDLYRAIKILSGLTIGLLEHWDGYLRENYYSSGYIPDNELELVAYEAGRSLATLSWRVTVKVEPLEKALSALKQTKGDSQGTPRPDPETLRMRLNKIWMDIFNERDIIHAQHQIAALKTVLDDAYYRTNKQAQASTEDAVLVRSDLNLPSHALQAVILSLDYWQHGVAWICKKDSDPSTSDPSTKFWEQSETLRLALIQQADIWQSLILCQQSLQSFSVQSVTQKILGNFMAAFQQFAVQGLSQAAQGTAQDIAATTNQIKEALFQEYRPILLAASISLLVIVGVLIVLLLLIPNLADSLKGIFTGLLVLAFGGGSLYARNRLSGTTSTTPTTQPAAPAGNGNAPATAPDSTNVLDRFSGFLSSFGSTIMSDFERGYQQILIEFDSLNHNVSVAFPFIEFFILSPLAFTKDIKDGYDFLTTVIWTKQERSQEIERIAQAAFGPIGAFVGAQLELTDGVNSTQPAKQGNSMPLR